MDNQILREQAKTLAARIVETSSYLVRSAEENFGSVDKETDQGRQLVLDTLFFLLHCADRRSYFVYGNSVERKIFADSLHNNIFYKLTDGLENAEVLKTQIIELYTNFSKEYDQYGYTEKKGVFWQFAKHASLLCGKTPNAGSIMAFLIVLDGAEHDMYLQEESGS